MATALRGPGGTAAATHATAVCLPGVHLTFSDWLSTDCQVSGGVCHTGSPGAVLDSMTIPMYL